MGRNEKTSTDEFKREVIQECLKGKKVRCGSGSTIRSANIDLERLEESVLRRGNKDGVTKAT